MRVWTTLIVSITAALAVGVATASPTSNGGNSANAKACQNGGWKILGTRDGKVFIDQGGCVDYAAGGGIFGVAKPDLQLVVTGCELSGTVVGTAVVGDHREGICAFTFTNVGAPVTGTVEVEATLSFATFSDGFILREHHRFFQLRSSIIGGYRNDPSPASAR